MYKDVGIYEAFVSSKETFFPSKAIAGIFWFQRVHESMTLVWQDESNTLALAAMSQEHGC